MVPRFGFQLKPAFRTAASLGLEAMPKEVHKGKVYAVANGRSPGVYNTWEEAEAQVRGFANNRFRSFSNPNEAAAFMQGYQAATRVRASDARAVQPAGASKARASELSRSQPYAAPAPVRPATQARPAPPPATAPRRAPAVRTAVSQRSTAPVQETYPVSYGAPSAGHQGPRPRPQPAAHSLRLVSCNVCIEYDPCDALGEAPVSSLRSTSLSPGV